MLAVAFARAIAPAGAQARRYDASGDNRPEPGSVSIARAASGPFFVPVARDVLAVDADTAAQATAAVQLENELRGAGLWPVVDDSGQPGRVHLLVRIERHAEHARWRRRAEQLGLGGDAMRSSIRPPFALHRNRKSRSIPRGFDDPRAALALLAPRRKRPRVSREIWNVLKTGQHPTRYRRADGSVDRSAVTQAIMVAFVAAGWRFGQICSLLKKHPNGGGAKLAGRADADRLLLASYDRAVRYVECDRVRCTASVRERVQETVGLERARAEAARWKGTGGGSSRALLAALHDVAERSGRSVFAASTRQLADDAGVGVATASRGLARLVRDGWIVRLATTARASTMRWRLPETLSTGTLLHAPPQPPLGAEVVFHSGAFSHDAARFRGLGKQKARALNLVLSGRATTVAELVVLLGTKAPTVRKHVGVLIELGLLVRDRRRLRGGPSTLDEVAQRLGVAGVGALQRSGFESEREFRRALREMKKRAAVEKGATIYAVRREAARFVRSRVVGGTFSPRSEQEAARPERNGVRESTERASVRRAATG